MMDLELLGQINNGVQILVLLRLLEFVCNCMRSWRINTMKMGGK